MAFALKIGFLHRKELPAIQEPGRLGNLVDLYWWIDFTKRSPRMKEVVHVNDRPTAIFTLKDSSAFEVRYQFGFVVPQELDCTDRVPMEELVDYMNEWSRRSALKHVRYQSTGNTVGIENAVDDFWEIDDDGHVVRSVQILLDGSVLKYGREHDADSFGILPEGVITEEMLSDHSVGKITRISLSDFEAKWALKAKNEGER